MKRVLRAILAAGALVAVMVAFAPGTFRLVVLQPVRDILFFQRELEPWRDWSAIERVNPRPTAVVRLLADPEDPAAVDIELGVWVPETDPAPVALVLHGASPRGRKLGFNKLLAQRLQQAGWLVLTPDARGLGGSSKPGDPRDPEAWAVDADLARLVSYASTHPQGNGTVIAIGHSMGGSLLLQVGPSAEMLAALVLKGPSRHSHEDDPATWWQRARFASDRRMARLPPPEVYTAESKRSDITRIAAERPEFLQSVPILLMDGGLEGEQLVAKLSQVADFLGPNAVHVTVPEARHYCGAYQLPWPARTVFVRMETFDRCLRVITDFLETEQIAPR